MQTTQSRHKNSKSLPFHSAGVKAFHISKGHKRPGTTNMYIVRLLRSQCVLLRKARMFMF